MKTFAHKITVTVQLDDPSLLPEILQRVAEDLRDDVRRPELQTLVQASYYWPEANISVSMRDRETPNTTKEL